MSFINSTRNYFINLAKDTRNFLKPYQNSGKYLFYGVLVGGGVVINNYEKVFNSLHIPNSILKKWLDRIFHTKSLENDVKFSISNENTIEIADLAGKNPEDILQINAASKVAKSTSDSAKDVADNNLIKLNELEEKYIKELNNNKAHINLQILELETKLMDLLKNRSNVVSQVKLELQGQNEILDKIYNKIHRSKKNEFVQWAELKQDNVDYLKSIMSDLNHSEDITKDTLSHLESLKDKLSIKKVMRDKELEIMRSFMANYNPEIIKSHERVEKLKTSIENISKDIGTTINEISKKEESVNTLKNLELRYLAKKQLVIDTLLNANVQSLSSDTSEAPVKILDVTFDPIKLLENDKKMVEVMQYLFNRIDQTNNRQNLKLFNRTLHFFSKKVLDLSHSFQDEFMHNLITRGKILSRRFYSHVEIENDFQAVKRNIFYQIYEQEIKNKYSSLNKNVIYYSGKTLSKATELVLRFYYSPKCHQINLQKDSQLAVKVKTLSAVNYHIKNRNYDEAYQASHSLRNKDTEALLAGLNEKLENMTTEAYALELMKKHLS